MSNTSKFTHTSLRSVTAYKTVQYALFNSVLSTSQEVKGLNITIPILKMRNTRLMIDSEPDRDLASKMGLRLPCSDFKVPVLFSLSSNCPPAGPPPLVVKGALNSLTSCCSGFKTQALRGILPLVLLVSSTLLGSLFLQGENPQVSDKTLCILFKIH